MLVAGDAPGVVYRLGHDAPEENLLTLITTSAIFLLPVASDYKSATGIVLSGSQCVLKRAWRPVDCTRAAHYWPPVDTDNKRARECNAFVMFISCLYWLVCS
jgi:hypothetical protein